MNDQVAAAIMDSIVELNKRAKRIAELEAALYRIRDFDTETPGPAMQDIARKALESDE